MGLWPVLLSEKPFLHKQGCQTTKSEDGFQAFHLLQLHYIWCGGRGEGAVKITKRSRGGAELIPLLWTGGHYIIIFPLKLISQFPLLIIIGQSLTVVAKFLDLDNDGHCIFERWKRKVWTTVLLLSAIVHRLRRCQYFFGFFFLPYLQDLGLLKSRNFARMATWLNDFFLSFMKGTCLSLGGLPHSLAPNMLASRNSR